MRRSLPLVIALVILAAAAIYFLRRPVTDARAAAVAASTPHPAPREVATARQDSQTRPAVGTASLAPRATTADPFELLKSLAQRAYVGDARAQYVLGRELDKCEWTLTLIRKAEGIR